MKLSAVEFVQTIIDRAIRSGASDIHIDPFPIASTVRFRIDGLLRHICTLAPIHHQEVISRIKILGSLRTDIHRTAQDGRFRHKEAESTCDMRISIMPTQYGENAVLRILIDRVGTTSLAELGISPSDIDRIESAIKKRHGLILITGPTGSGKTTTLYALIAMLNTPELSIVTLEDPVEYAIDGIRQIQVSPKYGITFASGLRAILRQDPNIIVVGEIRDNETAAIAMHSALTGHLVLSTLHTNSAVSAITRLLDMGSEAYLISATLSLVIGQRLVRKRCEPAGFKGRVGIYETFLIDETIRKAITARISDEILLKKATAGGMRTMHDDGMTKIALGMTTEEELTRVLYQ